MKIFDRLSQYFISRADERTLRVAAETKAGPSGGSISSQIVQSAEMPMAKAIEDYLSAVTYATDPEEPMFSPLADLYKNLLLDNHLASVIDSRILYCQRSPFKIIDEKGDKNEDLTELFERPWFEDLTRMILMSRFRGRMLLELFEVNENGELATVDEIPQSHFNVIKGIITKEEGDTNGWPYKEGKLANYYLQVGKDFELGMLSQMAPAILAKKLGMGAWQDFLDKYGVPPLFITTDRMDAGRLTELYEAGKNFKHNNFMIGQGNEKFEVGNTGGVSSADTFDLMIQRVNSEVSKRVLGGSGLTDEKGYVGSTEIQFKLAENRFESDRLLLKNIINAEIFPRLIKLSPVYAPLANHYFEWDKKESMSKKDIAELVDILNRSYDVDPEWVEQETGVPIIGVKSNNSPSLPNSPSLGGGRREEGQGEEKKKP